MPIDVWPRARIMARSSTLRSSRTLPSHCDVSSRSSASELHSLGDPGSSARRSVIRPVTSASRSARVRSRSGGSRSGITLNRYSRSSRNRPARTSTSRS